MKTLSMWIGLLVPSALLLAACAPAVAPQSGASAGSAARESMRTITVVGHGEASAKPDIARTNLGVEATAPTVAEALNQANNRMTTIIAAVKKAGVADKDIRTSNFNISFERPYQQPPMPVPMPVTPPPEQRGAGGKGGASAAGAAQPMAAQKQEPSGFYRVSNMVEVTVRDVSKAGAVLEAAVNAGANNVWNLSFQLDETKAVEAKAREKAVADARARAEDLARLSGVRLGSIVSVSTIVGAMPGPMPMAAMMRSDAGGAPPLEAGELTWRTEVQVVFDFAPAQ